MGRDGDPDPVQVAALLAPAHDQRRGGDFYLVHRDAPLTTIVVGDVTGKGEAAAPYAERARELLGDCLHDNAEDPAVVLERLNTRLHADSTFEPYVCASALVINADTRSATWAFAGHVPPLWLDTGFPVDGARPGHLLGLDPSCGATSAERRPLRPGEGLVLFTDGLEDVVGRDGGRFGVVRVTHALAGRLHGAAPEAIVNGLKEAACSFGGGELYDDICIVAVRLL